MSNVVYELRCQDCFQTYLDETTREINVRVAEHERRANKPPKDNDDHQGMPRESSIAGQATDSGH